MTRSWTPYFKPERADCGHTPAAPHIVEKLRARVAEKGIHHLDWEPCCGFHLMLARNQAEDYLHRMTTPRTDHPNTSRGRRGSGRKGSFKVARTYSYKRGSMY